MKTNTKRRATTAGRGRISPPIARFILSTHGAAHAIANIAGVSRGYVSHVLHGQKPASAKLRAAWAEYFRRLELRMTTEVMRAELEHLEELVAAPK